jgi:regulator of protease activity HflC (stomatin/prohibitin superfamily)
MTRSKYLGVLAAAVMMTGCGFEVVDTGNRGVLVRYGEVDLAAGSLPEGLHTYNPLTSDIIEMDTRILRWESKTNTYTRDVQQANITFVVNYRLSPTSAHIMYKEVGLEWHNTILDQAVVGELKKVVGQYDAVDLIANRGSATGKIQAAVTEALSRKDILITGFELVDISYLEDFEKAVEDKVVAKQRADEAVNKTKQIDEEAKQTIIAARAQAESMRIRANALAQNPALVQYEAVQKWNGQLPQYNLGGGAMPFISIK